MAIPERVARLTADQVHAMLDAGILRDAEGLELIRGLLVYKDRAASGGDPMTIGELHNLVIKLLNRLDPELVTLGSHMQTQGPVRLSETDEPEPDGAVIRGEPRDYARRIPGAADVLAVIEVADSSLEYDRSDKAALYAGAGILQYVIVNLREGEIEVHESPTGGGYKVHRTVSAGGVLELRASPSATLSVAASRLLP